MGNEPVVKKSGFAGDLANLLCFRKVYREGVTDENKSMRDEAPPKAQTSKRKIHKQTIIKRRGAQIVDGTLHIGSAVADVVVDVAVIVATLDD